MGRTVEAADPAASNSSLKNGLPPAREAIASTMDADRAAALDGSQELAYLFPLEAGELHLFDTGKAAQFRQPWPEWVASMELIGPIGRDEEHAFVPKPPGDEFR